MLTNAEFIKCKTQYKNININNNNVLIYYYNKKYQFLILILIPLMVKLNCQQQLQQSLVPHDPSEIILICWFEAQETCIMV